MTAIEPSSRGIRVARRLMVSGLVVSVMGNGLVEGGVYGLAASLAVSTLVVVVWQTMGKLIVFAFPVYARFVARWAADRTLMVVDLIEGGLAILALVISLVLPGMSVFVVTSYVFLDLLLGPVADIADEFYGASLAEHGEEEALAYNAAVESWLAFCNFVIIAPLGSVLSGVSLSLLLAISAALSLMAAVARLGAMRRVSVARVGDVDMEEYEAGGQRYPWRLFLRDLFRSGPASPLLQFAFHVATALTGYLLFLWAARLGDWPEEAAMAVILAVFGGAATLGPQLGRVWRKAASTATVLQATAWATVVNVLALLTTVLAGLVNIWLVLAFIAVNVTLSRARLVVLSTHRQTFFKDSQFTRVMSWSYAFGAFGGICGLQLAYLLGLNVNPAPALAAAVLVWIAIAFVVRSRKSESEGEQAESGSVLP